MRRAEIRVLSLLLLAVSTTVAATYWLSLVHQPMSAWTLLRGSMIICGAMACSWLAFFALRRDWASHHLRAFEDLRDLALAEGPRVGSAGSDPLVSPCVITIRDHIDVLQSRISQLQIQRKSLEIQLRLADAERRQSQTMINGISDAVLVTNSFDEVILANPVAAKLFKIDLAAAARPAIRQCIPLPKLVSDISDIRQNHLRANRRTLEYALEADGTLHTFAVTMTCVNDSAEQFSGVVTVLHDTTREREIAALKSEFVSHVSHELRTPLSSIKAYAELLVDGEAADESTRHEFYHIIHAEADRLSRLIDNILNISRIESGMTRINKKPVDLATVAKRVLDVAMPSAREKNLTLLDLISPVYAPVHADGDMIYQAVLNLVGNAIKYTPENGTVKVVVQMDEVHNQVRVSVIDSGVGIPPEAMKHLFEKFYRVEQHKAMAKGSGLGLNLTRQIIETIHKGKMVVESEPGKGSTFGFTLPVSPVEART